MQEPKQLNEEDLAPLLGQHQLTIVQQAKTIRMLRTRLQDAVEMIRILIAMACGAVLLVAHGPVFSQEAPDTDGDGWTDGYEFHIGTSPALRCIPTDQQYDGQDAWAPDLNRDNIVDIY